MCVCVSRFVLLGWDVTSCLFGVWLARHAGLPYLFCACISALICLCPQLIVDFLHSLVRACGAPGELDLLSPCATEVASSSGMMRGPYQDLRLIGFSAISGLELSVITKTGSPLLGWIAMVTCAASLHQESSFLQDPDSDKSTKFTFKCYVIKSSTSQ